MLAALACLGLPGLGKKHQHGGRSLKELRDGLERVSHKVELLKELQHSSLEPLADEEPDTEPGNDYQLAQVQSEGSVLSLEREESLVDVAKNMKTHVGEYCATLGPKGSAAACSAKMLATKKTLAGKTQQEMWDEMVNVMTDPVCADVPPRVLWGFYEFPTESEKPHDVPPYLETVKEKDVTRVTKVKGGLRVSLGVEQPAGQQKVNADNLGSEYLKSKMGIMSTKVLPMPIPPECITTVTEQKVSIPIPVMKKYIPTIRGGWDKRFIPTRKHAKRFYENNYKHIVSGWTKNYEQNLAEHFLEQIITPSDAAMCSGDNRLDLYFTPEAASGKVISPETLTIDKVELCWTEGKVRGGYHEVCSNGGDQHKAAAVVITLKPFKANPKPITGARPTEEYIRDKLQGVVKQQLTSQGKTFTYYTYAFSYDEGGSRVFLDCPTLGELVNPYSYADERTTSECRQLAKLFKQRVDQQLGHAYKSKWVEMGAFAASIFEVTAALGDAARTLGAAPGGALVQDGTTSIKDANGQITGSAQNTVAGFGNADAAIGEAGSALDDKNVVAVANTLAAETNKNLFKADAEIKRQGIDFFFNTVGCGLGLTTAVFTAGAAAPLAVAGCARFVSSGLKLISLVMDSYSAKKWISPTLDSYIVIQNQFKDALTEVLKKLGKGEDESFQLKPDSLGGLARFTCAVTHVYEYSRTFHILKGGDAAKELVLQYEQDTVELVDKIKNDVLANLHLESVDLAFTNYQMISNVKRTLDDPIKGDVSEVKKDVKNLKDTVETIGTKIEQLQEVIQAQETAIQASLAAKAMMPKDRVKEIQEGTLKVKVLASNEISCAAKSDEKLGPLSRDECEALAAKEGSQAMWESSIVNKNDAPPDCIFYENEDGIKMYEYNTGSVPDAKETDKDEKVFSDVSKCGGEKPEGSPKISCVCAEVGDGEEKGFFSRAASAVGLAAERISDADGEPDADELQRSHARALGSEELTDAQRDLQAPVEEALESLERAMDARS
jgi:hypothetical protein